MKEKVLQSSNDTPFELPEASLALGLGLLRGLDGGVEGRAAPGAGAAGAAFKVGAVWTGAWYHIGQVCLNRLS